MTNVQIALHESLSSSSKRRNRWDKVEDFTERQITVQHANLEDELHMISQTSSAKIEPTNQSNDIPKQLEEPIVKDTTATASKSKWDDDDDDEDEMTTNSVQQNQTQPES
jgi:hypothetical protein